MEHQEKSSSTQSILDPGSNRFGHASPLRLSTIIIASIFGAEVIAMIVVRFIKPLPYYQTTIIDAGIMTVLIFPVLYLFSFSPLLQYIEKLRKAEKQVREMALFPALNPDAVVQVDANGHIRKSNAVAEQIGLGSGMELFELIPAFGNVNLSGFIEAGSTKDVYEAPLGDRILQWTMRGAPNLGLAFLYSKDVTERKRSEEAVRMLSSIVEQTADTVVVTNCSGIIEYVNPAFESLTGYQKEEAVGQTPRVLKSGVHDEHFYRKLWETVLNGQIFHSEITNRKKDGEVFHEAKTITPLRDEEGNITHFVATGKDITERRQAEEQLRKAYDDLEVRVQDRTEELVVANAKLIEEINGRKKIQIALEQSEQELRISEEKAQNLVQYAPAAIYEMDLFGQHFLSVNDIACQWSGYTREEMLSKSPLDLTDPESKARFQERLEEKLNGDNIDESVEYRIISKDGHAIIAEMHVGAFTYRDGKPESVLVVAHDITRRKRAEDGLRAANEELTRFNRAMIGRELRMIEMKQEVNELCQASSQPLRYHLDFETE